MMWVPPATSVAASTAQPTLVCAPLLNACQVIDLLLLYGGDVEKFAGDSMIVVFVPTPEEAEGAPAHGV